MKNPKVSIVIPVYNGEKYIREAIDSALAQTYKNIEIIVVNDGSKDDTEKICKEYKNKINYYKKENGGVSTALNLALEKMSGEYFSWLSHDDLYYPNKIEEEIKAIEKNTIILSNYDLIDEDGKLTNKVLLPYHIIKNTNQLALYYGFINGITLLIPKEAFDQCGQFDENLRCTQDYDMWFRMILENYKFKHVNKILVSTRLHSSQTTNTSPVMLSEGNQLWINMMEKLPLSQKNKILHNEYNFYREMALFLKNTPYVEAFEFAQDKTNKLRKPLDVKKVKVSVIIPFYDEKLSIINRAIESVLNQTHKNLEIILINDNPNHYTKSEISKLTNRNIPLKYIENKINKGVSFSRNAGIENASGEYVAFLDADDEYVAEKIELQLTELVITNNNFSHTSYIKFNNQEQIINSGLQTGDILRQCIFNCSIATPTVMIKKSFLEQTGIKFLENVNIGEDTIFWLEMLKKTSVIGIDIPLTKVYVDDLSAAHNVEKQIEGFNNIIHFITGDDVIKHYSYEFSLLLKSFCDIVISDKNITVYENKRNIFTLIINTIKSLKNDGIKITLYKIKKVLRNK